MCSTTSKAMSERADCKSPKIQEIPSGQPVEFSKLSNTKEASVLSAMARSTMLIMMTPEMDQYTVMGKNQYVFRDVHKLNLHAPVFHLPRILFPQIFTTVVDVRIAMNMP